MRPLITLIITLWLRENLSSVICNYWIMMQRRPNEYMPRWAFHFLSNQSYSIRTLIISYILLWNDTNFFNFRRHNMMIKRAKSIQIVWLMHLMKIIHGNFEICERYVCLSSLFFHKLLKYKLTICIEKYTCYYMLGINYTWTLTNSKPYF